MGKRVLVKIEKVFITCRGSSCSISCSSLKRRCKESVMKKMSRQEKTRRAPVTRLTQDNQWNKMASGNCANKTTMAILQQ